MSRYLYTILFATLSIAVASGQSELQKYRVVSSASIFQDMAANIGGDYIESLSIVPVGGDPHIYKPTPDDATLVVKADLILVNGLTFEGWITKLVENSGTKAEIYTITEGIDPIRSAKYENAADPHAWMAASNGRRYIRNITDALKRLAPEHSEVFEENFVAYDRKLADIDQYIESQISRIPPAQRILITSHDAFAYFGRRYNVELNAIMGISTDAAPQTSDILRVSKAIKDSGVPAIFVESTINPKMLKQIADDNNVKIGGELFSDSLGDKDSHAPTYLDMLKHNTDVIVKALRGEGVTETKIDQDDTSSNWILYGLLGLLLIGGMVFIIKKMNV